MLRVDSIVHRFPIPPESGRSPAYLDALGPLTLDIPDGEFICIVGPSGCGKTTLLHIIAGLVTPTQGEVRLGGTPISALSLRRQIGIVFQKSNLMPWRTVQENLELPLQIDGVHSAERKRRAQDMIARLRLEGFESAFPAALSGGMAQRVAIGRALICDPPLLLLDEPFGALDAMTREKMQLDLMGIWSSAQKTAIMVTHSITEAVFTADRVVVMSPRPGRVRAVVPIAFERPRSLEIIHSEAFGTISRKIRGVLDAGEERDG